MYKVNYKDFETLDEVLRYLKTLKYLDQYSVSEYRSDKTAEGHMVLISYENAEMFMINNRRY